MRRATIISSIVLEAISSSFLGLPGANAHTDPPGKDGTHRKGDRR